MCPDDGERSAWSLNRCFVSSVSVNEAIAQIPSKAEGTHSGNLIEQPKMYYFSAYLASLIKWSSRVEFFFRFFSPLDLPI